MGCGGRRERKHESEVSRRRKHVLSICGALTWGATESRSSIVWKWHKHKFSGKLLNSS